jgi:death-on-curing family protein
MLYVGGKEAYPTTFNKTAALFHSLINNHPFHNGNKRVALVSAQVFLDQEGWWIDYRAPRRIALTSAVWESAA